MNDKTQECPRDWADDMANRWRIVWNAKDQNIMGKGEQDVLAALLRESCAPKPPEGQRVVRLYGGQTKDRWVVVGGKGFGAEQWNRGDIESCLDFEENIQFFLVSLPLPEYREPDEVQAQVVQQKGGET